MTTQDKIAALAAELTRIGKMPEGIQLDGCSFCSKYSCLILSTLLGVAAEVLALADIVIRTAADGRLGVYNWENDPLTLHLFDTYPEAVIAALKQIEEVKK